MLVTFSHLVNWWNDLLKKVEVATTVVVTLVGRAETREEASEAMTDAVAVASLNKLEM